MKLILQSVLILFFGINAFAVPNITKISDAPFRHYFLSYEDLATLSETERSEYLLSLQAFRTVLELSQSTHLEKWDSKAALETQNPNYFAGLYKKIDLYLTTETQKANANPLLRLAWLGLSKAAPLFENSFSGLTKYAARFTGFTGTKASSAAAARAGNVAAAELKTAEKAAEKVAAKFGLEAATHTDLIAMRGLANEIKAAAKAGDHIKAGELTGKFKTLLANIESDPAKAAKIEAFMKKAGIKAGLMTGGKFLAPTAVIEGMFNWDKLTEIFDQTPDSVKETVLNAAHATQSAVNSGVAALETALDPNGKPVQSNAYKPKADNGCIYGLWTSTWVIKGSKSYCTRPRESMPDDCNGEFFMCPNMGAAAEGVSNKTLFCIKAEPNKDISVRCTANFKAKLAANQLKMSQEAYDKIIKSLQFKGDQGALTLAKYCEGASTMQGSECGALLEIEKIYKDTKIGDLVVANANAAAAVAPAVPAPVRGTATETN